MKFYKNDIVYIKANPDLRGVYPNPRHDETKNPLAIFLVINPNVEFGRDDILVAIKLSGVLKTESDDINKLKDYIGAVIEVEKRFLDGGDPLFWESVGKSNLDKFYNFEKPEPLHQKTTIPTNIIVDFLGLPGEEARGVEESGLKYLDAPITQAAPGGSGYEEVQQVRPAMAPYVPDSPPFVSSAYAKPSEIVDVTADSPPYVPTSRHESGADLSQLDKSDDLSPSDKSADSPPFVPTRRHESSDDLSPSDKSDTYLSPSDKSDTYLSPSEKYKFKQELVALITKKDADATPMQVSLTRIKPIHNPNVYYKKQSSLKKERDETGTILYDPQTPEGSPTYIEQVQAEADDIEKDSQNDRVHLFKYIAYGGLLNYGDKVYVANLSGNMDDTEKIYRTSKLVKSLGYQEPIVDNKAFLIYNSTTSTFDDADDYLLVGYDIRPIEYQYIDRIDDTDSLTKVRYTDIDVDVDVDVDVDPKLLEGADITGLTTDITGDVMDAEYANDGLSDDILDLLGGLVAEGGEITQITAEEELNAEPLADVSILPSYMKEIPADLDDELELNNIRSEIITGLLNDHLQEVASQLEREDKDKIKRSKKVEEINNEILDYLYNTIEKLIRLVRYTKSNNPSSIAESILFSGKFPSSVVPGVMDVMRKYAEVNTSAELAVENKQNANPFVRFDSIENQLSEEKLGIGIKTKGRYIFSEVEKAYTSNVESSDRTILNQDAVLYTESAKKRNDKIRPFFDIDMQNRHLKEFEPLPAQFQINDSLYFFDSELEDRTSVFRYAGSLKGGNISLFDISDHTSDDVKLYKDVPIHIRQVLGHSYRNIDIPRNANHTHADHEMYEGNPDKSWCLKTENKILIEAENPTINSVLVLPDITDKSSRYQDFVKFSATEYDIGIEIQKTKNILDTMIHLDLNCIGFILFSKWAENNMSELTEIVSSLQVKILDNYNKKGIPLREKVDGISVQNSIENILESFIVRSRILEDKGLLEVKIDEDYLVINAKEDTHPMINKLLSYVQYYNKDIPQNKDSVKLDINIDSVTSVYDDANILRRLSMVLTLVELSLKWSTLNKSDKYRILLALKRYSNKNIIEKDDLLFYIDELEQYQQVSSSLVSKVNYDEGTISISDVSGGDIGIFHLENAFGLIKMSLKTKNYPSLTVIPKELAERMEKEDGRPLTELYFPYLLDSLLPTNTEVISKNINDFDKGISLGKLQKLIKIYGLSDEIVGDEFSLIINYILNDNIDRLKNSDRNIHYPRQLISYLQPFPKYSKNRFSIPTTEYEVSKLQTGVLSNDIKNNKFAHIFSDAFITNPEVVKAYGRYLGIIPIYTLNNNDREFLKQSGWQWIEGSSESKYGYSLFDSIESRMSWVKNQSDCGKFYFEFIKFYISGKPKENIEQLQQELEEAELKLHD